MRTRLILICLSCLFGLIACGDDPPPAPEDRCDDAAVASFGGGKVSVKPNVSQAVEVSLASGAGFILGPALYVNLPKANLANGSHPLILKLFTSDESTGLIDRVARATASGPATFTLVDASEPIAGSQNISGLNNYDCKFSEQKLCAQVVVDLDGDGIVSDSDEFVFNASKGSVTFIEAKGLKSSFKMTWTMSLVGNILNSEDTASGNYFRGCLFTSYRSSGADRWDFY